MIQVLTVFISHTSHITSLRNSLHCDYQAKFVLVLLKGQTGNTALTENANTLPAFLQYINSILNGAEHLKSTVLSMDRCDMAKKPQTTNDIQILKPCEASCPPKL